MKSRRDEKKKIKIEAESKRGREREKVPKLNERKNEVGWSECVEEANR